ncbi:phenylacetate--CoA ligase family protein [Alicyclobacillus suci]|uniref:phenylacetate--CoA ligase family protein n=1 Tax=Alicyclobacillus suci TaxID=2816080 RepID=UPI001A8ED44A|nr:phenylacetate--CoA ligase family protein [Alicyclobacillus suci]
MVHSYIDVFEKAGSPESLKPFIRFEQVWPVESLERHTEILKSFHDERTRYRKLDNMPREELDSWTLRRLQSLVKFSYEHISYYRRLYSNVGFEPGDLKSLRDFTLLPIIQKADLHEIYREVVNNPWVKINHKSRTSGSTGTPLSLINDTDRQKHWFVHRIQMFENMMQSPLQPEDWIYSIYYEPFLLTSILGDYPTFTVGLGASYEDLAEHIRTLKPKIVTGVGRHVLKVAELLPDAKELGILAFSTNSETSSPGIRRDLSLKLGVPILDEYSSEELGIIAWEERDGGYLVAEDTVHLELVHYQDDDMESVIGTDLWNFAMPRIRYAQNDYAIWKKSDPEYGLRRLDRILGRQDMMIISPTYGPIDPGKILEIFDPGFRRLGD